MKTIETKVYNFDELSDEAKETARSWFREGDDFSFHAENVIDAAKEIAKLMGINIKNIYYTGFYSQGDGACFEGTYIYKAGSIKAVREYAPLDRELHNIVVDLWKAQRPAFYRLEAHVKHRGHYQHSGCTEIEVYNTEHPHSDVPQEEDIKDALRSFMDWIYSQLDKENDYQNSDEVTDENILANEYTFTESGKRFG